MVLQGAQSRLKRQNTLFKTLNFVTKVFMMRHLLMSNCLFGMCCRAWICGVTRNKNVVSLVLQGAPSRLKRQMNKFFEWRIITQAVRTASYHILFNAPHCIIPFLKLTHKAVRILWYAGFSSSGYQRNLHKACEHEVSINPEINSLFFTINVDKRCVIDTQQRAGKSYFEEKKIELDYVTGATDNLWKGY